MATPVKKNRNSVPQAANTPTVGLDELDSPLSGPERPRGRLRNLLKDYYGIGTATEEGSKNEMNIDSHGFDSEKFFTEMLRTHTFSQLRSEDSKINNDIKELDGQMKTLVYENYEKFISAAETIRSMKSNIENMEDQMVKLSEDMKKISSSSDKINGALSSRRAKLEQLSTLQTLLKKLQFIVELPTRLNRCVELEAWGQAVNYYLKTSTILKKYRHLPSFQAIEKEGEQIMVKVTDKLKKSIANPKTPTTEVAHYVGLLISLGNEIGSLRNDYLSARKANLKNRFDVFARTDENTVVENTLTDLTNVWLEDFIESCNCFKSVFVDRETSPQGRKGAFKQLEEFTKSIFGKYFSLVRTILAGKETSEIISGLELIHSDLLKANGRLPKELHIREKAEEIINTTVQDTIENAFNDLQESVRNLIQTMIDDSTSTTESLLSLCKSTVNSITRDIQRLLNDLKMFFISTESSQHWPVFMTKIHVKMEQFFLFTNIYIMEFYDEDNRVKEEVSRKSLLLLSRLCLYMATETIAQADNMLSLLRQLVAETSGGIEYSINSQDLKERVHGSAETLLSNCVKSSSQKVSQMIWKSIVTPNWLQMKEPKGPRSAMMLVLEEFKSIASDVSAVFDSSTEKSLAASLSNSSPSNNAQIRGARKAVSEDRRSLPKKINFSDIEFNKNAILTEIIKISLRSFLEVIRLQTVGKLGLQQLQVDIHFMRSIVLTFVSTIGSRSLINELLDEVVASATERCIDTSMALDHSVVITITEPFEKKFLHLQAPSENNKN